MWRKALDNVLSNRTFLYSDCISAPALRKMLDGITQPFDVKNSTFCSIECDFIKPDLSPEFSLLSKMLTSAVAFSSASKPSTNSSLSWISAAASVEQWRNEVDVLCWMSITCDKTNDRRWQRNLRLNGFRRAASRRNALMNACQMSHEASNRISVNSFNVIRWYTWYEKLRCVLPCSMEYGMLYAVCYTTTCGCSSWVLYGIIICPSKKFEFENVWYVQPGSPHSQKTVRHHTVGPDYGF